MNEDDFEGLGRDHQTRPKQVYQGLTRDGCKWRWRWPRRISPCLSSYRRKKNPYEQIKSMIVVFSHRSSPIPEVTFRCLHVQCRVQPKNGISDFCNQHYRIVFQW